MRLYQIQADSFKEYCQDLCVKNTSSSNLLTIDPLQSFEDFCMNFPSSGWSHDIHFLPQSQLLLPENNFPTVVPDFIGRYEDLSSAIRYISQRVNINIKLSRSRSTCHSNYREYYTQATRKIIEEYYSLDLEYFNYKF